VAEIRVSYNQRFLCLAICPELAGETVSLRDIVKARNQRMRQLRSILRDRKKTIDSLFELKRGELGQTLKTPTESSQKNKRDPVRLLKRYYNDE
jgi:putative transposase